MFFRFIFCLFCKTWIKNSNFLIIHVKQLWEKNRFVNNILSIVFQELFVAMYEKCFAWCIGSNGTRSWQYDKFGWHYSRLNWFYLAEFLWNEQIMGANATPGTFKVHLIFIIYLSQRYFVDFLWSRRMKYGYNHSNLWVKSFVS